MENFRSNPFYYRLYGEYALFTDPVTKGGGEKFTYQIPTYQALRGITEEIYWKPTIYVVIDAMKVMKPIKTETKGIRSPMKNGSNDLNYYTYLKDVEYLVKFHFEWNLNRADLEHDRDEKKHEQIFLRSLKRGGRRDIFLGTRECVAHVEYIKEIEFENSVTPFSDSSLSFGIMFHSLGYPENVSVQNKSSKLKSGFAPIRMTNGKVDFIRPEDCDITHELSDYEFKILTKDNFKPVDEEYENYEKAGVIEHDDVIV